MLSYDRWHELNEQRKLSKDPKTFWPRLDVQAMDASGDFQRRSLAQVVESAHDVVGKLQAKRRELENDGRLTDEGRREALADYYRDEVAPSLHGLRQDMVAPAADVAATRYRKATAKVPVPSSPLDIAVAQESWRMVRDGKLGWEDVSKMSPEVKRAVALAPRELSGLPEHSHALVRQQFMADYVGPELEDAEAFKGEVAGVEDLLDRAEVAAQSMVGIAPPHPMKTGDPRKSKPEVDDREVVAN